MLSENQRRFFRLNGYLPIGQVSVPAEVARLKREIARLVGESDDTTRAVLPEDHLMRSRNSGPDGTKGHVRVVLHLCHLNQVFRLHALKARVVATVRSIFDEEPVVLTSLLFNKPPGIGEALTLHQDLPYYPYLRDDDLVTCWTALDDVDRDNGCLEYLPGSHRTRNPHRQTGLQQALDIDPATVDMPTAVALPLNAGEAALHHGLTVHRSAANSSRRPRMGLAVLYVRMSANVTLADFPYPGLVPDPRGASAQGGR